MTLTIGVEERTEPSALWEGQRLSARKIDTRLNSSVCGGEAFEATVLVYINDIAYALPGMKPKLFADDINLFIYGIDKTELYIKSAIFSQLYSDGLYLIIYEFLQEKMLWFFLLLNKLSKKK